MTPVDPILIVAVWLWGLRDSMFRSSRTVGALSTFTLLFVLFAVAFPPPVGIAARASAVLVALAMLKTWSHAWVALPVEQRKFDLEISRGLDEIRRHAGATLSGAMSADTEISRLRSTADALAVLRPPDHDWARVRDDIVAFVREQSRLLGLLTRGASVPDDVIAQRRQRAHEITRAYHEVRRRSRRFWS